MARFDTSGLQDLINDMRKMGDAAKPVARVMTLAAADEIRTAWKNTATQYGLIDTGAMVESIGYPAEPTDLGGAFAIDVYPQGTDASGTRNAEKAFILHYGSSRIQPTYWVDEADKNAEEPVQARLEGIWGEFLETGQVPEINFAPIAIGSVAKPRIRKLGTVAATRKRQTTYSKAQRDKANRQRDTLFANSCLSSAQRARQDAVWKNVEKQKRYLNSRRYR